MPDGPFEPAFTRDGRWIYVTCLAGNKVAVVDAERWEIVQVLAHAGLSQPHGVAVSPDGRFVYVSNRHQAGGTHDHEGGQPTGAGTVVAICVATRTVEHVLTVGRYAAGMGTVSAFSATGAPPASCR